MSQPSRIDTGELRAMVSTLERLIAEASRTVGELKATIASAETLIGDHHDDSPVPVRADAPLAQAPAAAPPGASERKALPTPWSRRAPATPWSQRVVRPCPTVPSIPIRVSAARAVDLPAAELSVPSRQQTAPRYAESDFPRDRGSLVDDSVPVERTVFTGDSQPTPRVFLPADSAPIRKTDYRDQSAVIPPTASTSIGRSGLIDDSTPFQRTDAVGLGPRMRDAPTTDITDFAPAGQTAAAPHRESVPKTTEADGFTPRRHIDSADESSPIQRTGPAARTAAVQAPDVPAVRRTDITDHPAGQPTDTTPDSALVRQSGIADNFSTSPKGHAERPAVSQSADSRPIPQPNSTDDSDLSRRPEATGPPTPIDLNHPGPIQQDTADDAAPAPQIETEPDSAAVPRIDTPHRTEDLHPIGIAEDAASTRPPDPGPSLDTAAEPVVIERTDPASRPARAIADEAPPRGDNERRPELISPIDLANCLASAQRTVSRSTESATPWGLAPRRQPDSTHDSAPIRQVEAGHGIAADGRTDAGAALQETDPVRPSAVRDFPPTQPGDFADGFVLSRRTEATSPLAPLEHTASANHPGGIEETGVGVPSASIDTATGSAASPRIDVSHDSDAIPPIGSSKGAPAARRNDSGPHRRTGSTSNFVSTPRTDPASLEQSKTPVHREPVQRTADPAARASDRPATAPAPQRDRTPDSAPEQRNAPAPSEQTTTRHRPPPPRTDTTEASEASEASRIAQEMAERHDLEIVGFDAGNVDSQAVREIVSAIDDLLAKYPIPLRGIELTDDPESRPRPNPTTMTQGPAEVWIVLDKAAPHPPGGAAPQQTRRVFRRRGPVERPMYTTVVREFARALDVAGGFRARQEALRTLINESLLRGGSGAGLLDPGRALVEGFTEVVLRGDRAGASAKELHAALVKMARADSTDVPEHADPTESTDLPEATDLTA